VPWATDYQTAALAPFMAAMGVSVTIRDPETGTTYSRTAVRWQLEGFGDPFNEWHWLVYNDSVLGVTAPKNGWTVTDAAGVVYTVGKVTFRGNGAAWDLWTRTPEAVT